MIRVDTKTLPGVVVLMEDDVILASSETVHWLKVNVSVMLARREIDSLAWMIDEFGIAIQVKDWSRS